MENAPAPVRLNAPWNSKNYRATPLLLSTPHAKDRGGERNLWFFVSMAAESVWKLFTAYFWRSSKSNEARLHRSFGYCCCSYSETPPAQSDNARARGASLLDTKRKMCVRSLVSVVLCAQVKRDQKRGANMYIFLSRCEMAASAIHCRKTFYIMSTCARNGPLSS